MSLEQRGHAGFDSFDRKVRQGRMIKPSINLQELRRRIYRKAKAEKQWRFYTPVRDEAERPPRLWLEAME
jgi:hypothetical protein